MEIANEKSLWPALSELGPMDEPARRRELRWHCEAGIDSKVEPKTAELRRRLDKELERITLLELEAQLSPAPDRKVISERIRNLAELGKLAVSSQGFAQYLYSYLYFGVRFAIGRARFDGGSDDFHWNERAVGLPGPPEIEGLQPGEAGQTLGIFRSIRLSPEEEVALRFLDGFVSTDEEQSEPEPSEASSDDIAESTRFELWLRGLFCPGKSDERRFRQIASGLLSWASNRYQFYVDIERRKGRESMVDEWQTGRAAVEGHWVAKNPLTARFGVADFYWLARLLRAEVTPRGVVTYGRRSWLYYFSNAEQDNSNKELIRRMETVLREVFDFACELIQNSVQIAEACEAHRFDPPPKREWTKNWRAVYDHEIEEISNQRSERLFQVNKAAVTPVPTDGTSDLYWSRRIRTGEHEENLIGIALSGGGIRSATFCLGVLQALKDFDFLRHVDFLSTVSGGGYIGAWLLGNVRRTRYWLSRMTSWDESIGHLRRYSKYLAPHSGALSADQWVIWATWIRNALLIQLTAISCLAALFVAAIAIKLPFDSVTVGFGKAAEGALLAVLVVLAGVLLYNLFNPRLGRSKQHLRAAVLAWIGSFLAAALLWRGRHGPEEYSHILSMAGGQWPGYLSVVLLISFGLIAMCSIMRQAKSGQFARFLGSVAVAILSGGVSYLALCGVIYVFDIWASWDTKDHASWFAFVFGPPLVMLAMTLGVVIFIGLIGGASADWRREWWTRYGSLLALFGSGFLGLTCAAVFGPVWVVRLAGSSHHFLNLGAIAGWAGSVVAGLLSGHSAKTRGNGAGQSKVLEWVARLGGLLFIVGVVLAVATAVHILLAEVWLDQPSAWWMNLNLFLAPPAQKVYALGKFSPLLLTLAVLGGCALLFSWRFNINIFGLNQFYRNRLVRAYLGATRWRPGMRHPEVFTGFDDKDDLEMTDLQFNTLSGAEHFRGPFPIVNCSLNLGGSSDLTLHTRQSASFTLTPIFAGADRPLVGYAPVRDKPESFANRVTLGQAISISGAAASPNMGYNTSPLVAVLLTLFNVRLAWWFPNPGKKSWSKGSPISSLSYLVLEFFGLADETSKFVNVSDGGHFENLGIYELVRRRARVIIASDAECDSELNFGSLGNVIRLCETDFGATIDIDLSSVRKNKQTGMSAAHCAVGRITYSNGSIGYLVYLKASLTGDEETDIQQYHAGHSDFPHQSTADQFFAEDQFESYRRLGHHVAQVAFRSAADAPNMVAVANKLFELWAPAGCASSAFVNHASTLDRIWERFRRTPALGELLKELIADRALPPRNPQLTVQETCACLELIQLMENVFLDLRLDDFWDHPDNRGWAMLFTMWAKSPSFRLAWEQTRRSFGIRFEYFCGERLGLPTDRPVRVV